MSMLVGMLDDDETHQSRFGVSLNIPGGVLYGQVISRRAYEEEWETSLRDLPGPGSEALARVPRLLREAVDGAVGSGPADRLPRWVHLRDATFLTGAANQTMHFALWRGRLADVAGWSLSLPS
ncbi:hypothetical protein AMK16_01975 [Streptomyces sp. CB00455]|nr:hypothetical protein AMK16_01975 [Streptomyces sp. CB00455]